MEYLASLNVIQHTSAEYLGLIEDHLEGRRIRFQYHRPFTERGTVPTAKSVTDGLILLGGGPWGSAGPRNLPTLVEEIELAHDCLKRGVPVIGIGLGAQILTLAAGGKTHIAPLAFEVGEIRCVAPEALNGYLPDSMISISYQRDQLELPAAAQVLYRDAADAPAVFQIGANAFGFRGHPGFKPAIVEDLIMEFEESAEGAAQTLKEARMLVSRVEADLIPLMTGLIQLTGWMEQTAS